MSPSRADHQTDSFLRSTSPVQSQDSLNITLKMSPTHAAVETKPFLYSNASVRSHEGMPQLTLPFRLSGDMPAPTIDTSGAHIPVAFDQWQTPSPSSAGGLMESRRSSSGCVSTPGQSGFSAASSVYGYSQPPTPANTTHEINANNEAWFPVPSRGRYFDASYDPSSNAAVHGLPMYFGIHSGIAPYNTGGIQPPFEAEAVFIPKYPPASPDPMEQDNPEISAAYHTDYQTMPSYALQTHGGTIGTAINTQQHIPMMYGTPHGHVIPSRSSPPSLNSSFTSIAESDFYSAPPSSPIDIKDDYLMAELELKDEAPHNGINPALSSSEKSAVLLSPLKGSFGRVCKSRQAKVATRSRKVIAPGHGQFELHESEDAAVYKSLPEDEQEMFINCKPDKKMYCEMWDFKTKKPCESSFSRPEHHKRHWLTHHFHDKPKPFKCDVPGCHKSKPKQGSVRADNMRQHYACHLKEDTGKQRKDRPLEWPDLKRLILAGDGFIGPPQVNLSSSITIQQLEAQFKDEDEVENHAPRQVEQIERSIIRRPELNIQLQYIQNSRIREELEKDPSIWDNNKGLREYCSRNEIVTTHDVMLFEARKLYAAGRKAPPVNRSRARTNRVPRADSMFAS